MEKPPKMGNYDGKGDPDKHMQLVNNRLSYFSVDGVSKCKLCCVNPGQTDLVIAQLSTLQNYQLLNIIP